MPVKAHLVVVGDAKHASGIELHEHVMVVFEGVEIGG